MIPANQLHAIFEYNPETGDLLWRVRNRNLTGTVAGGVDRRMGYRRVRLGGKLELAHRIIIAMTTGQWPEAQVDHINGDRDDNRIANLRAVDRAENLKNKAMYGNNKSGRTGVYWHGQHRKWCATISVATRIKHLGLFHDLDAAIIARRHAEVEYGFHPNHGRAAP